MNYRTASSHLAHSALLFSACPCADKWFLYPEQDPNSDYYLPAIAKRPNFGIAVSGGGYRAVTLALGYVRSAPSSSHAWAAADNSADTQPTCAGGANLCLLIIACVTTTMADAFMCLLLSV